jgi:heme oxygenase
MVAVYSSPRSSMLDRLDRETESFHAQAESQRMRLLADPSPTGYRRFLATMYRFRYAVERELVVRDDLPISFVYAGLESGRLGDTLISLGLDAAARMVLARPSNVPRLSDGVEALGWIYVVERSYLHERSRRRDQLGRLLDEVAHARDAAAEIVVHAREAFERQELWYAAAEAPASVEVW